MKKLPELFLNNMKKMLEDEYDLFISSYENSPVSSLRINTNKISVKDFLKINPFHLTPVSWCNDGFYYSDEDEPAKHPYYHAGLYYIQEASAMLSAEILPIEENDIVLDACSAPGGKSLKLANKLNNTGLLISNDISVSRAQILLKNLESHGVTNAIVMAEDLNELDIFDEYFDKILIDAPCSGEGMFRKDPTLINHWDENINYHYASIQKKLLDKAVRMLKPSGKLVYSTCTFSMKENEEVIEYILDKYDDMHLVPVKKVTGIQDGLTDKTKECMRLFPHLLKAEGHFVALLEKDGNKINKDIDHKQIEYPDIDFFDMLHKPFYDGQFITRNDKLYFQKNIDIDLSRLRILRNGLFLGEFRHDRFEPSQALASSLKIKEYDNIINFDLDDIRVLKYLKCETLDVKDKYINGHVLVCTDGFPLGFGIVNKGVLKNRYPANYRYK